MLRTQTILMFALAAWLTCACSGTSLVGQDLPTAYGQRSGSAGANSLNGTSGFARMFEDVGIDVQSTRRVSPRIDRYDTLVWFPDTRQMISDEERLRLEDWLAAGWERTLIVVGRDYDATRDYLEQVSLEADDKSRPAYRRRLSQAVVQDHLERLQQEPRDFDGWVAWEPAKGRREVKQLAGPLANRVNVRQTHLIQGRYPAVPDPTKDPIFPDHEHNVLLSADGEPFVVEVRKPGWDDGRVLVVSNGSFLLNYGLTYGGNRQLAYRLIEESNAYDSVIFLESNDEGLNIVEREESRQQTMWDWMREWPFSFIIPHFLVVGMLVYFVYIPIYGRPKRIRGASSTDFGQHVEALGELMEKTRDRDYAVRHLNHYHEHVRRDSAGLGVNRSGSKKPSTRMR